MLGNQDLYLMLQKSGFVVVFKEILTLESGEVKGNIDAELILQAMIDYDRYDQALIISGDGDFTCLLRYLDQNNKLLGVIAPYEKGLSFLIQKVAEGKIDYLRSLRKKIEYRGAQGGRVRTKPMPPMKSDIGVLEDIPQSKQKIIPPPKLNRPKKTPNPVGLTQEPQKHTEKRRPQNTPQQKRSNPSKNAPKMGGEEIYGGFGG